MALLFTIRDANDHSQGYCFLFAAVRNLRIQDATCRSANLCTEHIYAPITYKFFNA